TPKKPTNQNQNPQQNNNANPPSPENPDAAPSDTASPEGGVPLPKGAADALAGMTPPAAGGQPRQDSTAPSTLSSGSYNNSGSMPDPRRRAGQSGNLPEGAALAEADALVRSAEGRGAPPPSTTGPTETDEEVATRLAVTIGVPREMLL